MVKNPHKWAHEDIRAKVEWARLEFSKHGHRHRAKICTCWNSSPTPSSRNSGWLVYFRPSWIIQLVSHRYRHYQHTLAARSNGAGGKR